MKQLNTVDNTFRHSKLIRENKQANKRTSRKDTGTQNTDGEEEEEMKKL